MTETPAEFLEPPLRDEPEPEAGRDRDSAGPRVPRASEQLDTPDEPYGDG